jgi:hypothetical protein
MHRRSVIAAIRSSRDRARRIDGRSQWRQHGRSDLLGLRPARSTAARPIKTLWARSPFGAWAMTHKKAVEMLKQGDISTFNKWVKERRKKGKSNVDLDDQNLSELKLSEADLRQAHLNGANLRKTDLKGANLHGAKLRQADLRGCDLRQSDLGEADLRRAKLKGARLKKAKTKDAKGLS